MQTESFVNLLFIENPRKKKTWTASGKEEEPIKPDRSFSQESLMTIKRGRPHGDDNRGPVSASPFNTGGEVISYRNFS